LTHSLLKQPVKFAGFGPSILVRQMRSRFASLPLPEDRRQARQLIRENCPTSPGVYGWLDTNGQLAYVGKSKYLRQRLLSYLAVNPSDSKADRIRRHCPQICWEPVSHELLALLREQELIHRWQPQFNSMGQPTRMRPAYLYLGGSPAPNIRLARRLPASYLHAFGPIYGTKRLGGAIESMNHVFKLRDCPDKTKFEFHNQKLLFDDDETTAKCIRHELGTCPGPCAGKCDRHDYAKLVQQAVQFLSGQRPDVLTGLECKMRNAAARQAFEVAAIYRDYWKRLSWLDRRLAGMRIAQQQLNGVLEIDAKRKTTAWMLLRSGKLVATVPKPDSAKRADLALTAIDDASKGSSWMSTDLLEMSLQLIVIAWFRKNPETKGQLLSFDQSREHCRRTLAEAKMAA